jgi:MFS family permease
MFSFALPAMTAAIGLAASGRPFVLAASLVVSAFGALLDGTLATRFGRVRVLMYVVHRYALLDLALQAAARKGAR